MTISAKLPANLRPHASGRRYHVIIDTPAGSRVKYKYDRDYGMFKLSKVLPRGMVFPGNFGFIPGTAADDGDELDMLILCDEPLAIGILLEVRLLGALRATQVQSGKTIRNDRLVGVPVTSANPPAWRSLRDVPLPMRRQIEAFFVSYNEQQGRRFRPQGWIGIRESEALIRNACR